MNRKGIVRNIEEHCEPIIENLGYDLVDLEYLKERGRYFLRFYIGRSEGIGIDDCQIVSEAVGKKLDELDLIEESYYLEVSSPGLERPLKTNKDLKRNIGKNVEISLYKNVDGKKKYIGQLLDYTDTHIKIKDDTSEYIEIDRKTISNIKLVIDF